MALTQPCAAWDVVAQRQWVLAPVSRRTQSTETPGRGTTFELARSERARRFVAVVLPGETRRRRPLVSGAGK